MTAPGLVAPAAERVLVWAGWPEGWGHAWPAGVIGAVVILAVTFVLGWFLKNVVAGTMRKLAARTATDLDDQIVDLAEKPAFRLVQMIGVYLAVLELPFPERVALILSGFLLVAVILVTIRLVTQIGVILLLAYGRRVQDDAGRDRFVKDYVPLLSKILGTVLALMGLIAVLHHFGQDVSSVVAALGIGGLAISFAAKDTLGNMFAGFTILLDRPFRPGDRIKLATGEIGDVLEVGTRSTRLRLLDANMLIVPNSELVQSRVTNFNFPSHATRATLEVGIAYGADVELAKRLVLEAITAQPEVTEPPAVQLVAFADSALSIAAWYIVAQYADAGAVQDRVRVQVYAAFQKAGVRIPYPTREIVMVGPTPPAR
jgi:small-conductance mechanosensitive channel